MKKLSTLIVLVLAAVALYLTIFRKGTSNVAPNDTNTSKLTILVSGFGEKNILGRWAGESAPFLKKMDGIKDVSASFNYCQNVHEGFLYGNKVLVVSTGMAKVETTACIVQILEFYGGSTSEVIVVGTAGITPMKGGMLDSSGMPRDAERVMLGDICINYLGLDFDLQYYSSDLAGSDVSKPEFQQLGDSFSNKETKGSLALAQELYNASSEVDMPSVPKPVEDVNLLYHQVSRKPKVWKINECLEVTSDMYWNDIKADNEARKIAAEFISKSSKVSLSEKDVVVVTSMESLPVGLIVEKYNAAKGTRIAFAYVRSASNFDQVYLTSEGLPATSFVTDPSLMDHENGTKFAIENAAMPVLKMLELRSQQKD